MAEAFKSYFCDWCGQIVTNCQLVYHCNDCDECFCQQCAKLIPQKPKKRYERIKEIAMQQDDGGKNHWIWNVDESELETFERMMKKSKRLSNVTFDLCKRDGLTPGCYPYEYDINCVLPIDDSWPIGTMKPWRKYDPENEHRQLTRHQKEAPFDVGVERNRE